MKEWKMKEYGKVGVGAGESGGVLLDEGSATMDEHGS